MISVLRILLIIVVAWYLIRFIDRWVVPALFGNKEKDRTTSGKNKKEFKKSTRQGDVTITDYGKPTKDVKEREDDYIDYEEVE